MRDELLDFFDSVSAGEPRAVALFVAVIFPWGVLAIRLIEGW